ncbi:MAG: sodium:solute symporter family protein [Candidatus Bipolaricaulota bacterium]|nr:sodium:solute symporter family protein [Candidatus Bipolaricaulota bacterium]MDW8031248.1 sodium:solute symporter family protein [Candidatus Bipolaricaulota bacterium]
MTEITTDVLAVAGIYLFVLLIIGWWSYKKTLPTPEDFFMAGRAFGPIVLILTVYATNMTAFYMLGTPGNAYRQGIGTYGYIAFASALVIPAMFYLIGYRAWLVGKRYGYMTPPELLGARYESSAVALVLFVLLVFYTVPYIVTSVIGAGLALESLAKIPYLWGAAGVLLITMLYTVFGGMRGTAWTSVFQGLMFMIVGVVAFVLIANALGGFATITQRVYAERPELLQRTGNFDPKDWFSFLFIAPLAVIAFPHVFMRLLTGKSERTLKALAVVYPLLFLLTWPPVIYIGLWGSVVIPGLDARSADAILPMMIARFLPPVMLGLGLAAIWAAIMSTLDAMMLTLSTMLTRDLLGRLLPHYVQEKRREVVLGRLFIVVIAFLALLGALFRPGTIYDIAKFAFTGYSLTVPAMLAAFYWKRSTAWGVLASLVIPNLLLPLYYFTPYLSWSTFGFLPVVPLMVLAVALLVVVSLLTRPPSEQTVRRFSDF